MMNFNMAPACWTQHGRGLNGDNGVPVRPNGAGLGIITDFPVSDKLDPLAGPNWNGYLVNEISGNMLLTTSAKPNNAAWNKLHPPTLLPAVLTLDPKSHLIYEFTFTQTPGSVLNYQSDTNNTDKTVPAGFRPFLKDATWPMMGNRWWSRQRWSLVPTGPNVVVLDVSLDPSNWFDVDGNGADLGPNPANSGYLAALARPTYIGLTFGGGFFAGHGVNVSNGNAQFCLSRMYLV